MELRLDHRGWTNESPYQRYFDFIAPDADRYQILFETAQSLKLNFSVITVEGKRHFFIFPKAYTQSVASGNIFPFLGLQPVILCAHYDRVEGTQGANDNSAAVFQLLKAALKMDKDETDYWMVVFTDKEELLKDETIQDQGAFSLAGKLLDWGLGDAQVYIFDACGTGDTLILSNATDYLFKGNETKSIYKVKQRLRTLRNHALDTAHDLYIYNTMVLPTPFSDDAGFLRAGIPAQTITMLPTAEAGPYATFLRKRPDFGELLISGNAKNSNDRMMIPETWRCLNTKSDSYLRLTPKNFETVVRFAAQLCK